MVKGLKKNGVEVTCLTGRPITTKTHERFIWGGKSECENGIKFVYMPCINNPIIKQVLYLICSFFYGLIWAYRNRKDGALVTDILCGPITKGSALGARIAGIPVNGIVTDLPNMLTFDKKDSKAKQILRRLSINPFKLCTHFTPLTEQMCEVINKKHKPYVIVEGLVDSEMKAATRFLHEDGKRHICYTGQIYEQFGVKTMIEAFMKVESENVVLDIYGPGALSDRMPEYIEKDKRIVYHGCVPIEEAVKAQLGAYLLVNPRPSNEEFTKYSFPSKNVEYMVSGTPLLTTNLPGMPQEYHDYVFLIKNESVEGMADAFREILEMTDEEVVSKGIMGREFVLTYKNNVVQSKKIIDLVFNSQQ